MNSQFLDALTTLEQAKDVATCWNYSISFLENQGIDLPVYMDIAAPLAGREPLVLARMPGWWQEWYRAEDAQRFDPFILCCRDFSPSMTCISYDEQHTYLTQRERRFVSEAAETGAISGFSGTLRTPSQHGYAGWNFCSSENKSSFDKIFSERADMLQLFGIAADEVIRRLS